MPKRTLPEILTEGLFEHPAVQAWLKVRSDSCEPDTLEVLQQRKYSSVYRIHEQDGTRVIAKKCRLTTARIEYLIYSELLPRAGVPALHCYGLLEEQEGDRCWLFLEDAAGARYSRQIAENRALAGRWLAEAHRALGELLARRGALDAAANHLQDAVRLAPHDEVAEKLLATVRERANGGRR